MREIFMQDNFSKDLEKTIIAVRDNKFLIQSNSNFDVISRIEPFDYQLTPKYYNGENERKIDNFLTFVYGKNSDILNKPTVEKELACLSILKNLYQSGYIYTRTIFDRSYDSPDHENNCRVHVFREYFLSEKGLDIYFKITSQRNNKWSFRLSTFAIIISTISALYSWHNASVNDKRLEMQIEDFCSKSVDSDFCKKNRIEKS